METLNKPEVWKSIFSVTREEELLLNISNKSFKTYEFQLIENISDSVFKNSDKTPDWILSNENIKTILSNLSDFGVAERKLSAVRNLLRDYISDENPLPYANHRYQTRSKDGGAPFPSCFRQASTTVTGIKGSRKRAISDEEISSSSKQIRSSGTVNIARSPLPDDKKGVITLEVPVSMIEDVIESKKVVEYTSDALIEAQDQRPIEDIKVCDNLGPDVTMEVVKEYANGLDVPLYLLMSILHSIILLQKRIENFVLYFLQQQCLLSVKSITMTIVWTLIIAKSSNQRIPPSIILSEKRREIRDSFNEDETVFLVNTSFSSVMNPNDLKVSLSNTIRKIKVICTHFELDFESLSSSGDNGCSGLDMSIIGSKVQDLSDSVAGRGSDKKLDVDLTLLLEVDVATSIPSHVPAASTQAQAVSFDDAVPTSCPIALNQFNEKAIELKFLELVDKFLMEEESFVRFEGHNPLCSASITVFEHSFNSPLFDDTPF